MSDFLTRLLGATRAGAPLLRPRLPSRFAPPDVAAAVSASGFPEPPPAATREFRPAGRAPGDPFDVQEGPREAETEVEAGTIPAEDRASEPLPAVDRTGPMPAKEPLSSGRPAAAKPTRFVASLATQGSLRGQETEVEAGTTAAEDRTAEPLPAVDRTGPVPAKEPLSPGRPAAAKPTRFVASLAAQGSLRGQETEVEAGTTAAEDRTAEPLLVVADQAGPARRERVRRLAPGLAPVLPEERLSPGISTSARLSRPAPTPEVQREQETETDGSPEPLGAATTPVAPGERSPGLVPARRIEPPPLRQAEATTDAQRALSREPDGATLPTQAGSVLLAATSSFTPRPRPDDPGGSVKAAAVHPPAHVRAQAAERSSATHAVANAQATPAEPPVVRISIGRIDVRVTQAPAAPPRQPAARPAIGMSLESYLRRREGRAQ